MSATGILSISERLVLNEDMSNDSIVASIVNVVVTATILLLPGNKGIGGDAGNKGGGEKEDISPSFSVTARKNRNR